MIREADRNNSVEIHRQNLDREAWFIQHCVNGTEAMLKIQS
jgi:hypothetical protein